MTPIVRLQPLLLILTCTSLLHTVVASQSVLSTLRSYEELRVNSGVSRVNNVDVQVSEAIAFCHIIEMNIHSFITTSGERTNYMFDFPLQALAAVTLAMEHLNAGNGQVISAVQGLNKTCNTRFTTEFMDTAGSEIQAVESLIDIVQRTPDQQLPCAFIGAIRSKVSTPAAILTGVKGYPQVSALSSSPDLNDKDQYPLFGRAIPSSDGFAIPLLDYLYNSLELRHVAIVCSDTPAALSFLSGFRQTQQNLYEDMVIEPVVFPDNLDAEEWSAIVRALEQTKFRYFYTIVSPQQFEPLIREAVKQGIAGTGQHNWMVGVASEVGGSLEQGVWEPDSPIFQASKGLALFTIVGSLPSVARNNQFVEAWKGLANSTDDLVYLQSKVPQFPDSPGYNPVMNASVFKDVSPYTSLIYDAAILLGLAACNAEQKHFTGEQHYASMLGTTFAGASGTVVLDPETGSRNASAALYAIYNMIPVALEDGGNFTYKQEQVAYYDNSKWIHQRDPIFNDLTSELPDDLPPPTMQSNYIGKDLRTAGLAMSVIIMLASVGLSTWTHCNRESRVVKASQPIFLHLICFGALMLGSSIIPLSIDDEIASQRGCSIACQAFPWLVALGWCCSFSALFSKTLRINKIFHNPNFRRVKVSAMDVMKSMAVLMAINILILSLLTALAPFKWERTETAYDQFGRPKSSSGACVTDHALVFLILLLLINGGALMVAIREAFVARKISTEFAESEYIARAMSIILVVAALAVPIVIITEDNTRAYYFLVASFVTVVAMSLLLFIFVPKLFHLYSRRQPVSLRQTIRSSISLGNRASFGSSSELIGARITEHPKLRQDLRAKIVTLETENQNLKELVAELKQCSYEVGSSVS